MRKDGAGIMNVETLIYAYLAICLSMIIFNIVCIFVFRHRDKKLMKRSESFVEMVEEQIEAEEVDEKHQKKLSRKLTKVNHLMAFEEMLDRIYEKDPEAVRNYLENLTPVFVYLTQEYIKKNKLKAAYFTYLIRKYGILKGQSISIVIRTMLVLVQDESLYCRENALQALYAIGDADSVIEALKILDNKSLSHYSKMLTDGLMRFSGDPEDLDLRLWREYPTFSTEMKLVILNYFRFSGRGLYHEQFLRLMTEPGQNDEIVFSCIRYFGRHVYEPALPFLYEYADFGDGKWEYSAISAFALAAYPNPKTIALLKDLLCNRNWYVRYNAAESLERIGLSYDELIDVFEGRDRYAAEMLRYRFDKKRIREEAVTI